MLKIEYHARFKKDLKRMQKRGFSADKLKKVIELLANETPLPPNYKDHSLTGNYSGYRECHIEPDWLLIYRLIDNGLVLCLTRTGTHSDLF